MRFLKALDFEVIILPSAVADSLMGYLHSVKFSQSASIPYYIRVISIVVVLAFSHNGEDEKG